MKSEKILVILGVGFAAWVLAQAAFRANAGVPDSEKSFIPTTPGNSKRINNGIHAFGEMVGMSWEQVNKMFLDDGDVNELVSGTTANVGGVSGRPYIIIDDEPYLLSGK